MITAENAAVKLIARSPLAILGAIILAESSLFTSAEFAKQRGGLLVIPMLIR